MASRRTKSAESAREGERPDTAEERAQTANSERPSTTGSVGEVENGGDRSPRPPSQPRKLTPLDTHRRSVTTPLTEVKDTHRRTVSSPAGADRASSAPNTAMGASYRDIYKKHYREKFEHTACNRCERCMKKQAANMVDQLAGVDPHSQELLSLEMGRQPGMIVSNMYRPQEDYVHPGTNFQNVNKPNRGYFIIHPDFVSERGGVKMNVKENKSHLAY